MNALSPDTIDQLGLRQARQSRDPRFDGRFFVAVTSTGIYCRPICPAPMPKEANVQYYDSAIAAANAGYRPCLRCRPDSAPGSKAWQGNRTTLERAVGLIDEGALVDNSVSALAERLGITTRYLNKLFQQHLGTNAKQYALYQQLMLAKRLLHETDLAMAEVAYAAGFGSVRRFNDVFATMLKLTPGQIRRGGRRDDGGNCASTATGLNLFLSYRPPYDWARLQAFLASRAIPGLEWVDEDSYGRTLTVDGVQARFTAVHRPQRNGFDVELEMATSRPLMGVVRTVRRILDLDADSREIDQHLAALPGFDPLPGLRLPGLPAPFEAGCRAILGQQITVTAARKLVTTLVGEYGTGSGPDGPCWFPSSQAVAQGSLQELGMPQSRRDTLRRFAEHMTEPDRSQDTNFDDWLGHKGIGPWTVNYARMRALGDGDIWLAGDAGIKNALKILGVSLAPEQAAPWRSYLTLQLWNSL